jgi:L-fucono-1,5-lactonase
MRIDAHHHLWDLGVRPQPWLVGEALDPIARTFRFAELEPLLNAHGIDATVAVQSSSSLEETRELLAAAEESGGRIAGVVGWADLTDPALPDVLASLGGGALRGIRHQVQDEADPAWLDRPKVRRGLAEVARAGLVYDLLVTPRELDAALATAAALPEASFVLDHGGKPPVAAGEWEPWATRVGALAALPNVSCKLSGLVTEADHARWTIADIRPVWDLLLEAFGPRRLMFGSDWPVCVVAGGWDRWAETVDELVRELSPGDQHAILAGTATTFYRLEELIQPCC